MPCFLSFLLFFAASPSREKGKGWEGRTDLILAFNLVDPPTPHHKLPIGHNSCFSHKHFSLIIHGLLVSYYMYVSAKPGTFGWGERGLRYHVTVCARLLGYCLYIWDLTQVHLRIFRRVVRGVCCNRSDAENESPWVRVPLPFFFAAFCAWLV